MFLDQMRRDEVEYRVRDFRIIEFDLLNTELLREKLSELFFGGKA